MRKAGSGSGQQINKAAEPGACVAAGKQFLAAALPAFSHFRAGPEAVEPPWEGVHGWAEVPGGAAVLSVCPWVWNKALTAELGKQSPWVHFGPARKKCKKNPHRGVFLCV